MHTSGARRMRWKSVRTWQTPTSTSVPRRFSCYSLTTLTSRCDHLSAHAPRSCCQGLVAYSPRPSESCPPGRICFKVDLSCSFLNHIRSWSSRGLHFTLGHPWPMISLLGLCTICSCLVHAPYAYSVHDESPLRAGYFLALAMTAQDVCKQSDRHAEGGKIPSLSHLEQPDREAIARQALA